MQKVPFKQVDVFTDRGLLGNPVAVILDAQSLDSSQMQQIARWTNLSETTFVLPPTQPEASYRVRIFTPRQELPFAGHPSVGTAHALLESGLLIAKDATLIQECAAGLLPLRIEQRASGRMISVRSPAVRLHPLVADDASLLGLALGVAVLAEPAPQVVDNGPLWWLAQVRDEAALRGLHPDLNRLAAITSGRGAVGVAVFAYSGVGTIGMADTASNGSSAIDYELVVRCFCPADGIPEDPVTGSANACIAAWLQHHKALPSATYRVSQGRELGRDGKLELRVDEESVWVGGNAVTVVDGSIALPEISPAMQLHAIE